MSAAQKELIYVELRKYHLDEFPDSFGSAKLNELLAEYRQLEDQAVSMLLGLVNGKSEFADLAQDIKNFDSKVKLNTGDEAKKDRDLFVSKLRQLERIIHLAGTASFTIRSKPKIRPSTRAVITKVNKK